MNLSLMALGWIVGAISATIVIGSLMNWQMALANFGYNLIAGSVVIAGLSIYRYYRSKT